MKELKFIADILFYSIIFVMVFVIIQQLIMRVETDVIGNTLLGMAIYWLIFSIWGSIVSSALDEKGYSINYFIFGGIFGIIALLYVIALPNKK